MEFLPGQRVEYIGSKIGIYLGVNVGELGTVLADYCSKDFVSVRWDMAQQGRHSCGGLCEYGHGWNVSRNTIVHYVDDLGEFEANLAPGLIDDLLGGLL